MNAKTAGFPSLNQAETDLNEAVHKSIAMGSFKKSTNFSPL